MKAQLAISALLGLVLHATVLAQDAPSTGDTNTIASATNAPIVIPAPETVVPAPAAETKPVEPPKEEVKPEATTPPPAEPAPVAVPVAPVPAPVVVAVPVPVAPPTMRINLQDTTLTTAIETLARQAGINYMLDPRVSYGQPDPKTGVVTTQPTISIRWENVTAEQALLALLNNYGLQMVEDPKTHINRVTIKDPAAPEPLVTRIVQLKYASPTNMTLAVQTTFSDKRSKVMPDNRTSQLVVLATEKEQAGVLELVDRLDKPTRQVLIESRIVELSRNPSTVKGIDWSQTLENQNFSFGNGNATASTLTSIPGQALSYVDPGGREITVNQRSSSSTAITTTSGNGGFNVNTFNGLTPNIGFLNADGLRATLSFLNKDADAQVVSTPRAVTLDNETATLSVTRAVPIFKSTAGTQGSPGGSEVQYTNLGTILTVTPRISANDHIWLKVVPEVSSIFRTDRKIVAGQVNEADEYDIRRIETQVLIPSAHTLVMGGLMSDSSTKTYTKVPILGDAPVFGLLFRKEGKARDKRNLLIFITPTVVRDTDFQTAEVNNFLQSKAPEPEDTFRNSWDSGRPHDWSRPKKDKDKAKADTAAKVAETAEPTTTR